VAVQHILIVDDEVNLIHSLCDTLEFANPNYRVRVAESGAEALDILADQPVDLLVTDQRMPGLSGLDLINRMREREPQMRTLLITAFGSPETADEARDLGAVYLPKPFSLWTFVATVKRILDERLPLTENPATAAMEE